MHGKQDGRLFQGYYNPYCFLRSFRKAVRNPAMVREVAVMINPIVIDLRGIAFEGQLMTRTLITILSLSFSLPAIATEGLSSLEEQMTGKEYTAAGLHKLTPEELQFLSNWFHSHSVTTPDNPRGGGNAQVTDTGGDASMTDTGGDTSMTDTGGDDRGLENQKSVSRIPIKTRIRGSFSGWDGHKTFRLENGMIWEQADNDKFYIREIENPEITISPGAFKTWRLSVDGYHSKCRVERLQ